MPGAKRDKEKISGWRKLRCNKAGHSLGVQVQVLSFSLPVDQFYLAVSMNAKRRLSWPGILILTVIGLGMNWLGEEFFRWQMIRTFPNLKDAAEMGAVLEIGRIRGWTFVPATVHWFVLALGYACYARQRSVMSGVAFGVFVGLCVASAEATLRFSLPREGLPMSWSEFMLVTPSAQSILKYGFYGLVAGWLYAPVAPKLPAGAPPLPS